MLWDLNEKRNKYEKVGQCGVDSDFLDSVGATQQNKSLFILDYQREDPVTLDE